MAPSLMQGNITENNGSKPSLPKETDLLCFTVSLFQLCFSFLQLPIGLFQFRTGQWEAQICFTVSVWFMQPPIGSSVSVWFRQPPIGLFHFPPANGRLSVFHYRLRPAPSQPCSGLHGFEALPSCFHCTGEIERQTHLEIT